MKKHNMKTVARFRKPNHEPHFKTKRIFICGTGFRKSEDDFIRDGVIKIIKGLFPCHRVNLIFYNSSPDIFAQNKVTRFATALARNDLDGFDENIDAIIIAGKPTSTELTDLYYWIIKRNLEDRVFLIGGEYENEQVNETSLQEPAATIFKNAAIIIGSTKRPHKFISDHHLPYVYLQSLSIISVPAIKSCPTDQHIKKITFYIQLPPRIRAGNQSCSEPIHKLAMKLFFYLYHDFNIQIITHDKDEYLYFRNLFHDLEISAPVIFSSFYQDRLAAYADCDLFISTELRSGLCAYGHGVPAIIVNDNDYQRERVEGIPHALWVDSFKSFHRKFYKLHKWNLKRIVSEVDKFKAGLFQQYLNVLARPFAMLSNNNVLTKQHKPPLYTMNRPGARSREISSNLADQRSFPSNEAIGLKSKPFSKEVSLPFVSPLSKEAETKQRVQAILEELVGNRNLEPFFKNNI